MKLHLDFETRSRVDLLKAGTWAYASDPSTEIICMGWAGETGDVRCAKDFKTPGNLLGHAERIVAHNVAFEYAIYHFILHKRYGWPELLDPTKWDCTMARALACGLPGSLFGVGLALRLPMQKDLEGKAALMKICKPKPDGTWNEDPALYETVYRYNAVDVGVERAADKQLPDLSPDERKVFEADLCINRRGVLIDLGSARKAAEIAEGLTDGLNADLRRLTNGAVTKASRVAELKRWVAAQGVKIPTVVKIDKETNEETIKETMDIEAVKDLVKDPETPDLVKKVIRIRQQVGKSSVAKLKTMLLCVCGDGRFRGAFQYWGAHTGRWAGRLLQLQNFPQGLVGEAQEFAIEMLNAGAGFFRAAFGDQSMQTLSDILRGLIIAAPGKVFLGADYNAIEARVVFWLAEEQGALAQYARGESPYLTMGAKIFGHPITKKMTREYMVAKMTVLGAGFGMGWLRFQAQVYTETSKRGEALDIDDELAQSSIYGYRELYPNVVKLWYSMEAAAMNAVRNKGQLFACAGGRVVWGVSADKRFLCAKLPSGRLLRYFRPTVERVTTTRCKDATCPHTLQANVDLCPDKKTKDELRYWTSAGEGAIRLDCVNTLGQYRTWGGELVENIVQAVARDIAAQGILNVEAAGHPVVLHAHDEIVAEVGDDVDKDPKAITFFEELLCNKPAWAATLPIKAEGFIGRRYRK